MPLRWEPEERDPATGAVLTYHAPVMWSRRTGYLVAWERDGWRAYRPGGGGQSLGLHPSPEAARDACQRHADAWIAREQAALGRPRSWAGGYQLSEFPAARCQCGHSSRDHAEIVEYNGDDYRLGQCHHYGDVDERCRCRSYRAAHGEPIRSSGASGYDYDPEREIEILHQQRQQRRRLDRARDVAVHPSHRPNLPTRRRRVMDMRRLLPGR